MKYKVGDLVRFCDTYHDDTFKIPIGTLAKVIVLKFGSIAVELLEPFDDDEGFEVREIMFVEDCVEPAKFAKTELYKALNGE